MVYTVRNPKDVVVSSQNFLTGLRAVAYSHDLPYLIDQMVQERGKLCFGPYFDHVEGYWTLRNMPNVLIVSYEQLNHVSQFVLHP